MMSSERLPNYVNQQGASFLDEAIPHMDAVYRFALRLAGTQDGAEDLVQDTYFRAFKAWEQYTPGTRCKSWLFTICRNVFLRQREEILRAIDNLPDEYRIAVVLSDLEDLSYNEIAEIMEIPVGTVKSRLFRGRRQLQERLHAYAVEMGYISEAAGDG